MVDTKAHGTGLQKGGFDLVGVAVVEQVAEDSVDFDRSTFLEVAVHGRGEL